MKELLEINKSVTIHQKHLQILAIEVFKSITHLNPEFVWSLFNIKPVSYNLRAGIVVTLPPTHSVRYGTNSLIFRGSLAWNSLVLLNLVLHYRNSRKA